MNDNVSLPIGRRVAELRKLRGLTQAELAARLHRSESWVTKIERGERRIDSLMVIRELARTLSVSLYQLAQSDLTWLDDRRKRESADLTELRRVVDWPATMSPCSELRLSGAELEREATALLTAYATVRHNFSAVIPRLASLISRARQVAHIAPEPDRLQAHRALVGLYKLATLEFHRQGDLIRARVGVDRALMDAEHSGDPLLVGVAGTFIICYLMYGEPADAVTAVWPFIELVARDPRADSPTGTAILGALYCFGAMAAARASDKKDARRMMLTAARSAETLGRDGAPHGVFFGPVYLAINQTRFLLELGHPRRAASLGEKVQPGKVASVNRAGFHAAYLAWGRACAASTTMPLPR